MMELQAWM